MAPHRRKIVEMSILLIVIEVIMGIVGVVLAARLALLFMEVFLTPHGKALFSPFAVPAVIYTAAWLLDYPPIATWTMVVFATLRLAFFAGSVLLILARFFWEEKLEWVF